jgi:hypothetical protein
MGAELFHADKRTDRRDEANSFFFFLAILRTRLKTVACTRTSSDKDRVVCQDSNQSAPTDTHAVRLH